MQQKYSLYFAYIPYESRHFKGLHSNNSRPLVIDIHEYLPDNIFHASLKTLYEMTFMIS